MALFWFRDLPALLEKSSFRGRFFDEFLVMRLGVGVFLDFVCFLSLCFLVCRAEGVVSGKAI